MAKCKPKCPAPCPAPKKRVCKPRAVCATKCRKRPTYPKCVGQTRTYKGKMYVAHRSACGNLVWGKPKGRCAKPCADPCSRGGSARGRRGRRGPRAGSLPANEYGPTMEGQGVAGGRRYYKRSADYDGSNQIGEALPSILPGPPPLPPKKLKLGSKN